MLLVSLKDYYLRIEKYYSKDLAFEFVHFSVILLERLFRELYIELKNTQIVSQKKATNTQLNINLQEILKDEEIREFLSNSFYKYIEFILTNDLGLNLRNNTVHGLIDHRTLNHRYSQLLIHLIIVLINRVNTKRKKSTK